MKKQLLGLLVASLVMSSGYASFKQNVKLCVDATRNTTPYTFVGHFGSSDFFDRGHDTAVVSNQNSCVDHDYGYGPKHIFMTLKAFGAKGDVRLIPGNSCSYLANYKNDPATLASDYQGTTAAKEAWTLRLNPAPVQENYKAVFNVECERTSADK